MVVEAVFAVIAEVTRRDILEALATGHKAVGQLVEELGVSQPTVSKHLRVLREAGVVTMRAQGQKRFYSINTEPLTLVSEWLDGLGAGVAATPRPVAPARVAAPAPAAPAAPTPAAPAAPTPAASAAPAPWTVPATLAVVVPAAAAAQLEPAGLPVPSGVVQDGAHDPSVQQQITRSVGRAANKAADLLANLPSFRRRKD
ncbi:helix-turn-helix transcriptional regulator [Arthrobacter sp. SDTb3-6]|uniref:ArsR/SmtB family transcription factor n=1 Tax=Arthrobacter sp. SDTb3-6 TaxID=2713571 RepID=UPI00159E0B14|nr:metalloregulator ArsR/SmtB family transcription factor [Arthrobacter sp. SDTb3-6]NVM99770.1 winged helix-turn-helix transcriptional regulator [Arthrobacter sp. SDTb3-6]